MMPQQPTEDHPSTPETKFCDACAKGDGIIVRDMLHDDHNLLQCTDPSGYSPLHWASLYNQLDVVSFLLSQGADALNQGTHGDTPLHWATRIQSEKALDLLISHLLG